jgi:opacity protein-like surface antigen
MNRRQLIGVASGAATVFSLIAGRNWAQSNEANVQFHAFQDTRGVTVLTPTGDLAKDYTERTNLRLSYGLDAISAASDSCARCHRDGVNSHRQVAGLTVTQKFDAFKLTLGGTYSQENFYRATTLLTSAARDLANGNTTVAGGYTFSLNQPTLHPTQQVENQYQNDAFVSVTQTLSRVTIAQIGYELGRIVGYQDNPFLRTSVNGLMTLGHVPDLRTRQTVSARLRQALPANTYLEADYRHYLDDWQVHSNTLSAGLSHRFTSKILAGLSYRWYDQTGASFYQPQYIGALPQYYTADFRLQPFSSGLYTGKVTITPGTPFLWLPNGSGLTLQYERYRADNAFQAAIFSAGVHVPLGPK